jgi:uncharacterized membrane protein YvbJ
MAYKYCPKCGAPLEEGDQFCRNCGAKVFEQATEAKSETTTKYSTDATINTKTSFTLSIVGLSVGGIAGIIDIICIFLPINYFLLKLLSTSLETSAVGLIFSIVALCLNKPTSYKGQLSKRLSIAGIVVSSLALIGYFTLFTIVMAKSTLI